MFDTIKIDNGDYLTGLFVPCLANARASVTKNFLFEIIKRSPSFHLINFGRISPENNRKWCRCFHVSVFWVVKTRECLDFLWLRVEGHPPCPATGSGLKWWIDLVLPCSGLSADQIGSDGIGRSADSQWKTSAQQPITSAAPWGNWNCWNILSSDWWVSIQEERQQHPWQCSSWTVVGIQTSNLICYQSVLGFRLTTVCQLFAQWIRRTRLIPAVSSNICHLILGQTWAAADVCAVRSAFSPGCPFSPWQLIWRAAALWLARHWPPNR